MKTTVIFLPAVPFGDSFEVGLGNGGSLSFDHKRRRLILYPNSDPGEHLLVVRKPPANQ